jgi:hypothetical protein
MRRLCFVFFPVVCLLMLATCSKESPTPNVPEEPEPAGTPPKTWQETWDGHRSLLVRKYYNEEVAIYFDPDMKQDVTWPNQFFTDVWKYTKSVYGDFGEENRLYVIFHPKKQSGGHPAGWTDWHHDYRNVIDNGGGGSADSWEADKFDNYGIPIHEIGHIVEGVSKGTRESPAFDIWGDSKWCEIYAYDVYLGIGRPAEAQRVYTMSIDTSDDFPVPGTYWFRDWFYPIYSQYGGSRVLNEFFELLSKNFPTRPDEMTGGKNPLYDRRMNHGEFIHFWSGAAGTSLKELATNAFGWPPSWEAEFKQAKIDFPNITYEGI